MSRTLCHCCPCRCEKKKNKIACGKKKAEERRNAGPEARLSLRSRSHGYIHPRRAHHVWNRNSLPPRSHSRSIVGPWWATFSCFSHVRQLIPLSPRLLDSALVVWICRRAGAEGTILISHLPTASMWDNRGLSAGTAAHAWGSIIYQIYVCKPLPGTLEYG